MLIDLLQKNYYVKILQEIKYLGIHSRKRDAFKEHVVKSNLEQNLSFHQI